jgi:hypothetical protein
VLLLLVQPRSPLLRLCHVGRDPRATNWPLLLRRWCRRRRRSGTLAHQPSLRHACRALLGLSCRVQRGAHRQPLALLLIVCPGGFFLLLGQRLHAPNRRQARRWVTHPARPHNHAVGALSDGCKQKQ